MSYNKKKLLIIFKNTLIAILMFFCVAPIMNVKAVDYIEMESSSLVQWGIDNQDLESGYYALTVNDTTYNIHLYVFEGNQEWTEDKVFGDENDVGTATTYAQNMVVVLIKGNLTIASDVTVTAYKSTYGGPKGLFIYAAGALENNGTISMYGRGAYAPGQNVYLWYDTLNGSGYNEFTVPATGASGATRSTTYSLSNDGYNALNGNKGSDGTGRATGGGGSGAVRNYVARMYPGSGAAGTSYSGGSGGGAAATDRGSSRVAGDGAANGGPGGHGAQGGAATGTSGGSTNGWGQAPGGGQGNGPGNNVWSHATASVPVQDTGTGGLLILFCSSLNNKGTITANGVTARYTSVSAWTGYQMGGHILSGGSSGGGSVNIFYSELIEEGTITATGGPSQKKSMTWSGGAGGNGTVTTTQLVLEKEYLNPTLSSLEVEGQTMYPVFDSAVYQYGVTLDSENSTVKISGELTNEDNTITSGLGSVDIPAGTSTHNVVVTSKIGIVQIYSIEFYRPPSSYKYLKGITIDGIEIENFSPTKLTYDVTVPYDSDNFELNVIKGRTSQEVYGIGNIVTKSGNNTITITVVSEDGNYTTNYTLNVYREHSSKLKSLAFEDYKLDPIFDPETNTYTVTIMSTALALDVNAVAYDEEATISLKGFGYIKSSQTGTITVTEPNSSTTTYTINIIKEGTPSIKQYAYSYTGEYQTFTAPATGFYQIELWGAQGGNSVGNNSYACSYNRGVAYGGGCGGFGAYTTGTIKLEKGEILYVYVGQRGLDAVPGNNRAGGWNGGGSSTYDHCDNEASGSGGGATDIRLISTSSTTTWNEFESLKSRIMVAAGGGGGSDVYISGNGGTLTSAKVRFANGATQTAGYAFGYGENAIYRSSNIDVAGGGSGYFGGYSTAASSSNYGNHGQSGTGGSSFVSGCDGCIAIDESSTSQTNLVFTDSNVHYSGYVFEDISMIAGGVSMPSTSTGYTVGNSSNGYARITMINKSENNFLSSITVKAKGEEKTYTPDFGMETEDYYVELEVDETEIEISARPEDSTATISGLGTYEIPAGTTDIEIVVTAEAGNVKIYTVHVTRPASTDPYPLDIIISGLVPSLCSANESFCNLVPEFFDKDTNTYYLTVPSRIKQLYFNVEKSHPYQTVVGEGKVTIDGGENVITIEVTSEDGNNTSSYHYYVTRDMTGNTDLSRLEVVDPEREINYDPDITEYYLSVPNEYTEIKELIIETDDENANYIISGNENFQTGMNQVNILVTAENGETKTYVLNVYRERSGNTYLSTLEVINGDANYELTPEFSKVYTGEYQVTVPNEITNIEINATPEVETTTVNGIGLKELLTGTNNFTVTTTSEDGSVETYQLEITREKNNNANLSNIIVKAGENEYGLTPIFDSSTLEYSIEVEEGVSEVTIEATPEIETTTYKLLDSSSIKVGTNTKRIMAIAEDGTTQTYKITITRPANSNNKLTSLILEDSDKEYELTPEFNKEINEYTLEVENEVKALRVTGTTEEILSTVEGNGEYSLTVGSNEIIITVTAENGDINTYSIIVIRKASTNAYLSDINISNSILTPDFEKETTSYVINVASTVEKITITGIPEVETTTVTGNKEYRLVSGKNAITLTTLAEDGKTTQTYNITIIKDESDNANISNLYLEEGLLTPSFESNVISYTTKVPNEVEQATFHVKLADSKSTYEILGNENFEVGENTVIIRVTSEDGTTKDYSVLVTRREASNNSNYLSNLEVDKGSLTPKFIKEQQYYEVEVPYEVNKITVSAQTEDSYATMVGTGSYELKVGDNILSVTVMSADGIDRDYQILVKRAKNTEARLSAVTISGTVISPNFNKDITDYTLTTTESSLTFTKIEPVDNNATYEIIGNKFTENKEYEVVIRVTAEDGVTTKDYTFTVTKNPSNNNNLEILKIDGYSLNPVFNKATTLYMVTVPNNVRTVNVEAIAEDPSSTVTGTGSTTVYTGENQIIVEVTSESGNVKAYTILLTKQGSTNNRISELIVNNGIMTPEFNEDTIEYEVTVPYTEDKLDLTVILEDNKANYEIMNNSLSVGENIVSIMVTSENGEVNIYNLKVTREALITALLKELKIKDYELSKEFNSYVKSYDVLVDYEITSLDLTVIPLDNEATYIVEGNENFEIGENIVTITVKSRDGSETEVYTLNVKRQAYSNNYLDYLYTSLGDVTPEFDKTTLTYTIDVDNSKTSIELFGEAVDKSASVIGLGEHSLETGENKFPITVTTTTRIKRTYYVIVNRSKATDNFLETLEVKNGNTIYAITPEFDRTINSYATKVPVGTETVTLTGTISSTATVTGLGTKIVNVGDNTYEIKVTSENGDINTYKIVVTREASSNNYLTDLIPSIGFLEPDFTYSETNYTLNLDSAAGTLSFAYATEDTNALVTGIESQVVPDGTSTRSIIVKAEDGNERIYTITVNKERTDNAKLSSLVVTNYPFDIEFDPDIYNYKITVPNSKNLLLGTEVIAEADDKNATITKANNINLVTGENDYTVTVTAPDGFTKQTYTITVEREQGSNSLLNNLVVNKGTIAPNFNPNTTNYDWIVEKGDIVTKDDLTVTPADLNATINMTERLEIITISGNTYEIKVTSEDGTSSTTYILNVTYDLSSDATLKELIIDKGYYEPDFDSNTFTYDIYEYTDEEEITISATPTSETSTITSGDGTIILNDSEIVHTIVVTAEDGTIETYTLNIHKNILTDKGLINLGLNGLEELECINSKCELSPKFNTNVANYHIKVPYEYTNLDILVEKNEQQTVKYIINDEYIEEYSLPIGTTSVVVEVYDGMGTKTKEYTLVVERCKSNNTNLESLEITDYELEPTFNKSILEYTITVPTEVDEVEIVAVPEDSEATVTINGYNYLQEGENEASVTVTAPDGTSKTYIIHIIRSTLYNSYIKNITVSTGIFWDLTPKFKQTQFEYTTTVSGLYDRVTIEAVPVASSTVITGTGEYDIVTGLNEITLIATAEDGSTSIYKVGVIKENSRNVNLTSLIVEEGNLSPEFEKSKTNYEVTVDSDVEQLTIHAVLEDMTSSYIITGNEQLVTGDNTVSVIVMNSDKSVSKTYQIKVHKKASSNNYLSEIEVKDDNTNYPLEPTFNKLINTYYIEVDHSIEKVTILATSESSGAIIQGIGEESLSYGINERKIYVTAEDGSVNVYTVQIYRNYNLDLKDIISDIGTISPNFDKDTLKYSITLPNEEKEITFIALKESSEVKVTGNGEYTLATGDNEINFVVTAPDNKTKTYTVVVTRGASDNNYIESLVVHEGSISPNFDKETTSYEVNVRNTLTSVGLDITLEDDSATYEVIGNENLQSGNNIVTVRVTAENGDTRDYIINVVLQEASEFSNRLLDITITNGKLTPDFDPDINYYAATVANSIKETTIEVIKENVDATVEEVGKVSLDEGRNVFQIPVTSKDGIVNTYTLMIYRNGTNDATLSSLVVKNQNYSPIFNKLEENYQLSVGSEVTSLEIEATPSDPSSTVEVRGNKNITTGVNIISILVTAPDGTTTKTYTITVTKGLSTNNYLSSLKVNGYTYTPTFDKTNPGPYVVNLGSDINSVVIEALPEVDATTVTGTGKYDLASGQNLFQIQSTSESGDIRVYTVIINKAVKSDSTLKNIILSDGVLNPTFDPTILSYTVDVESELNEITVTGIANESTSRVTGNGTYKLDENNKEIKLEVEAEDGSKTTYTLEIRKTNILSSKLAKLEIKEGEISPSFHKNTLSYTVKVPYEVTNLKDMIMEPEDKEASYEINGNENFVIGTNTVSIKVTSSDGLVETTYTIYVVRQSNSSNYLKDLSVTNYGLTPEFNKTTLYYEVTVPSSQENISINAVLEDESSTLTGNGIKTLAYGENRFYINVTSSTGIIRTYSIVVNRSLDEENLLLTLTSSIGTLDKEFDPYTNEYTLTLPEKTKEVELTGTSSKNSMVVGLGKIEITDIEVDHTITVTSQKGVVNTYKIRIEKPASNNTNLISLTPSSGTLEYSNDIYEYEMEVEDNVSVISFVALLEDSDATVTGCELTNLNYNENEIIITVTAEDKETERTIKIKVIRNKELVQIIPSENNLVLIEDETKKVTYTLDPIDTTYTEVEWISLDEEVATVDQDGNIKGIKEGATIIQIKSTHNSNIVANINVNVINDKITSNVYDVNHDTELEYVIGIEPKTKLSDFIPNFENNPSLLHVYNQDGNEVTDTETFIGSYMTIKLIINETIYDELVIAVRGDATGEGLITVADFTMIKNYILGKIEGSFIIEKISDVTRDEKVTVADFTMTKNYILGNVETLN